MPESLNNEYKESWRDEYLKWICGFANFVDINVFEFSRQKGQGSFYTVKPSAE